MTSNCILYHQNCHNISWFTWQWLEPFRIRGAEVQDVQCIMNCNECITNWPWPNIGLWSRIRVEKYVEMCKTPIMTAHLGLGSLGVTSTVAVHLTMKFGSCVLFLWVTNKFIKRCNARDGKVSLCICGHATNWAMNRAKRWRQKKTNNADKIK